MPLSHTCTQYLAFCLVPAAALLPLGAMIANICPPKKRRRLGKDLGDYTRSSELLVEQPAKRTPANGVVVA